MFLANMSHELRTPLNAILGFAGLLRETRLSERQGRDLDIISRSGEHLLSLINDVLDMTKIDAGRVVIENSPVDLKDLVSGVIELMRLRAEEKGLELCLHENLRFCPFVQTDGGKLRQVLINLVGNALKFTERGSVILRVSTQPSEDSEYCRVLMEVQDTGLGIAIEEQQRILEPFLQTGKVSTQKGTGLGLAISKKFVELMGGSIQIESALGKGSLFRIEIPVKRVHESNVTPTMQGGPIIGLESGQPAYRVLIVEDQEENWLLLQRLLENAGFEVQVAGDGNEGIEKFTRWRPHFIWMDWRLPGMNGLEVTRKIRSLEGGEEVRIVILSAFAFTEYREQALTAGIDDFVSKSFKGAEIFDCLARQLGVRYTYQAGAGKKSAISGLKQDALAALPAELLKDLAAAVVALDIERITTVIGRISEHDPALGRTLSQHAETYAYTSILQAIQSSEAARR